MAFGEINVNSFYRLIEVAAVALALCALPAPHAVSRAAATPASADDILARSRALYAGLNSYADTGVVLDEYGTGTRERHSFTTYFSRAPRGFYFDFKRESGDRFLIWGDPQAFHSWWRATGVKDDYPNPNNIGAFSTAGPHTVGSALKIPTLLYSKAPFQGAFTNYTDAVQDGTEEIGGHRCYRLVGTAKDVYGATGHESNLRKMTVWIDAESFLIRQVVEVPKEILPGHIDKTTTTFEPQANPALDESRFKFTPPAGEK
jgi:outer membrane lipoprotein-sorting protein